MKLPSMRVLAALAAIGLVVYWLHLPGLIAVAVALVLGYTVGQRKGGTAGLVAGGIALFVTLILIIGPLLRTGGGSGGSSGPVVIQQQEQPAP